MRADAGAIRSTFSRGVSRWERGSGRGADRGSSDAETGGRRDVKNGRWMSRCGDMRSARGRGCGGVGKERAGVGAGGEQSEKNERQMSGRGDMRSARGRGGDLEHFFAGSIAVGAGERSRSRRRECGCGCGGVGKERAGVSVGGEQSVKNEWQMSGHGDMRRGEVEAGNRNFRGRERVRF